MATEDQSSNAVQKASDVGQSIWLDFIERDLVHSGKLASLIDMGVVGVTSNPTIFQKAIQSGTDYDSDLLKFAREDRDTNGIYEALALADIADAADILRPVYDRADGRDGFVSIEVDPRLAGDTDGTIEQGRRIFRQLDRPNILVKVPATPEGIPAVRTLIGEGINVNVTLIFSRSAYKKVARAYIEGLEDFAAKGNSDLSRIASVASFFVSRVDTLVDPRLSEESRLRGKAGVANAKLAYADFQEIFGGDRFAVLKRSGARPQRTLWASTSVKDPAYSDVMYMDGLIGPDTVNTVPPGTLDAFLDHGTVHESLTEGVEEARAHFNALAATGIDMDAVTDELLKAGVESFTASFVGLLECIDVKRQELVTV